MTSYSEDLYDSRCWQCESIPIGKLFTANIQCIKRICAVGAVLEEVFFTLGKFLAAFVLAETVAAAAYAGCLNGED